MDRIDSQTRSRIMSRIKGRDTKPELAVRRYLHSRGLRYKLHDGTLPGRPDMVFKSRKVAVFIHGCFWHAHSGCPKAHIPESRREYWQNKLQKNVIRDSRSIRQLRAMGWHVFVIWECQIAERRLSQLYRQIVKLIPLAPIPRN